MFALTLLLRAERNFSRRTAIAMFDQFDANRPEKVMSLGALDEEELSNLPLFGVPVPFEISDQRWTEMAIGLLSRIDGKVLPKQIDWFLTDAEGATIGNCANHARAC